uniref:Nanos-type domain-containing protein n=1 Tax=Rhabditophanes sp. KR3021 TaxID=114890 RepID=A0AC35UAY1_9BILA
MPNFFAVYAQNTRSRNSSETSEEAWSYNEQIQRDTEMVGNEKFSKFVVSILRPLKDWNSQDILYSKYCPYCDDWHSYTGKAGGSVQTRAAKGKIRGIHWRTILGCRGKERVSSTFSCLRGRGRNKKPEYAGVLARSGNIR